MNIKKIKKFHIVIFLIILVMIVGIFNSSIANTVIKKIEGEDIVSNVTAFSESGTDTYGYDVQLNVQDYINVSEEKDTEAPELSISYSQVGTMISVDVTITANEEIQGIDGWTLSSDRMTLTKSYTENITEEITVYDLSGNGTTVTITVDSIKDKELIITSDVYEISDIDNPDYITNVPKKTKVSTFMDNITTNAIGFGIMDSSGNVLEDTEYVATGMTIEFNGEVAMVTYTIVVTGDVNGDGDVKASDLSKIKTHMTTSISSKQLTGAYLEAADINFDGKISATDLSQVIKLIIQ